MSFVRPLGRIAVRLAVLMPAFAFVGSFAAAAETAPRPDAWLTNACDYPAGYAASRVVSNHFASLRAEAVAGRLKILWTPPQPPGDAHMTVLASIDPPGHWPARDWRSHPMARSGQVWEATLPVTDLDLPIVYFVSGNNRLSPMRLCHPEAAGLEQPTRVFWPFLEGFEEGLESWRLLGPSGPLLKTDPTAHTGKAALGVALPPGKHSVTIATTRLRGWHVWKHNATGLSLWMRTRSGDARVRFTLFAHALTSDQEVSPAARETRLTSQWQKVDLPFQLFPRLALPALDLMSMEFIGEPGQEVLVDDLHLLGPWEPDL